MAYSAYSALQWACASIGKIEYSGTPHNPAKILSQAQFWLQLIPRIVCMSLWVNVPVVWKWLYSKLNWNAQVNTLKLVGVSHLIMVPQLRTSHFTFLLSGAFPALRDSSPGNIQEPAIPKLRNLVVVNNTLDSNKFRNDLHGLKSAIDWRELMIWREDSKEKRLHQEISASLHKDDVINLQFTRLDLF